MAETAHVARVKLQLPIYEPQWKGAFENWARTYVYKNAWRLRYSGDTEDCLQICGEVFSRCAAHYRGKVDNPAWFMSLFKIAVVNQFISEAKRIARTRDALAEYATEQQIMQEDKQASEAPLLLALKYASQELKTVLTTILQAPSEFLDIFKQQKADRAKWSRRLCRLSNVAVNDDLIAELEDILDKVISK